mmetsp:Transcript_25898/g.49232  ORF Transcript_25898/g.49232 Transcript_25898/m.49232 type:complete len:135 (+) Transcript_25898:373-777(+)
MASNTHMKILFCRSLEQHTAGLGLGALDTVGGFVGTVVDGEPVGELDGDVEGAADGELLGVAVGEVGEAVGGVLGHGEPRRVPLRPVGQYVECVPKVTPAGTAPHKPGLLHISMSVRTVRAPSSDGNAPASWLT